MFPSIFCMEVKIIKYSIRGQKHRNNSFEGFFWTDPTDICNHPAGLMRRIAGPCGTGDYLRIPEDGQFIQQAVATSDLLRRNRVYLEAQAIFMEYLQWIPAVQRIGSDGM